MTRRPPADGLTRTALLPTIALRANGVSEGLVVRLDMASTGLSKAGRGWRDGR